jgi:glycosyltransferase involved in cell wall biosynthesis
MDNNSNAKYTRLAVFLPAYNEAKTIGNVIRRIERKIAGVDEVLVIVVDDGSTDDTAQQAIDAGAFVVKHSTNLGVGQAFGDGIAKALELGADIISNLDADGQHDPSEIPQLIAPILAEQADVVLGSRFMNGSRPKMPIMKDLGNRFFTKLMTMATGVRFTDTQSGFRAFSRTAALKLNLFSKFTYTQEALITLVSNGMIVQEVPITVKPRKGKSKVVKTWHNYGFRALAIILRSFRDVRPLTFFGILCSVALIAGFSAGGVVFINWLLTGRTFPYTSLITFSALCFLSGLFLFVSALIADMQGRQRCLQEETLYYLKRLHYDEMINHVNKGRRKADEE